MCGEDAVATISSNWQKYSAAILEMDRPGCGIEDKEVASLEEKRGFVWHKMYIVCIKWQSPVQELLHSCKA